MGGSLHPSESSRPRVVIVGSGASGVALASMLGDVDADVTVLAKALPPGRKRMFPGIINRNDARLLGVSFDAGSSLSISRVTHVNLEIPFGQRSVATPGLVSVTHSELLERIAGTLSAKGIAVVDVSSTPEFARAAGEVAGGSCREIGIRFGADLVVLADESDPRLAEQLGLRPDWLPTELMHIGKQYHPATPETIAGRFGDGPGDYHAIAFQQSASWGSPGYGLLIPGRDSISLVVTMLLEDEMASERHIGEYLDEITQYPAVRDLLSGLEPAEFVTEVVPIGGFDTRQRFHTDHVLAVSDLLGITHPLNRDGFSANLSACSVAATSIREAVASTCFTRECLARYSTRITDEVVAPINAARRTDKSLRARPAWQWAARPELVPAIQGMTSPAKSETLTSSNESGVWNRLRGFGRTVGLRRHAPGEHDE